MIPLTNPAGWQDLKFSKIPPNQARFQESGLSIQVNKSASPLVYPMLPAVKVRSFKVELEIEGELKSSSGFPEDAYFRLGLVIPGERRLGTMARMVAPDWVKRLFALAPKDSGIDKILFFVLADAGKQKGQTRVLPNSRDLIVEEILMLRAPGENKITFSHTLSEAKEAAALWLSTDGDNTGSAYKVLVKSIQLN